MDAKIEKLEERLDKNRHDKADIDGRLTVARGHLETLIGSLGAHDQLKERLKENETQRKRADNERRKAVGALSGEVAAIDLLASLASREVADVRRLLQPLYDDGSIPISHLMFVQGLLEKGTCVCGQDLTSHSGYKEHVQHMIEQSSGKEQRANYLAQVLHAATSLHRHKEGEEWRRRRAERGAALANLDNEISELSQARRDIDAKLAAIDNVDVDRTRGEIDMLENHSERIEREIVSDQRSLEEDRKKMHELQGIIRSEQRRQREARDLETYESDRFRPRPDTQDRPMRDIRNDQVHGNLVHGDECPIRRRWPRTYVDDEAGGGWICTRQPCRMIAKVGLRPLEGCAGRVRDLRAQQPRQVYASYRNQRCVAQNPRPVVCTGTL